MLDDGRGHQMLEDGSPGAPVEGLKRHGGLVNFLVLRRLCGMCMSLSFGALSEFH